MSAGAIEYTDCFFLQMVKPPFLRDSWIRHETI